MSVRITISYDSPEELEQVIILLESVTRKVKVSKSNTGTHRKAYIDCLNCGDKSRLNEK